MKNFSAIFLGAFRSGEVLRCSEVLRSSEGRVKSIVLRPFCPAEVTGHQKLYSMTDSETSLNTRPVVSRGSVSL
ncbi:hypothetical protein DPMN_010701 [Dreissena polymorpha]|uniref:Uncharacterized protein n=1 Tax=Dreissena polymorpha TaxID=45954 RepID=A0A9D4N2I7_DREPO|nr:hypothetical protein DPMN_010701 [Dreissena polymorpha]